MDAACAHIQLSCGHNNALVNTHTHIYAYIVHESKGAVCSDEVCVVCSVTLYAVRML